MPMVEVSNGGTPQITIIKYAGTVGSSRQGFSFTVPNENMNDILAIIDGSYNPGDVVGNKQALISPIFTMNGNVLVYYIASLKVSISGNTVTMPYGNTPGSVMYLAKLG